MRVGLVLFLLLLLLGAGCRAGVAPGAMYRAHDGEVVGVTQVELGGYIPRSHVGGLVSLSTAETVGETESHSGWIWFLFEARYRRVFHRWTNNHAYWAVGAAFGDGSRGPVGGGHGEVGIEVPTGGFSIDVSLRHRLLFVADGERTRPMSSLQLGLTLGWTVDR